MRTTKFRRVPAESLLYGFHAARAALENERRIIEAIYATENALARLQPQITSRKIEARIANPAELDALAGEAAVHQGIVLHAAPLDQPSLEELLDEVTDAPVTFAVLDQVTDPHNVGAVLRSAAAFGVSALIVQERHSPPLSAALAKAASGGLEHVAVIETVNLARALDALKEHHFECVGFDSASDDRFSASIAFGERTCFVFGAEDKGLRRLVRETCDRVLALSAPGPIKSLNVSNAAAIVFHGAARTRK